MSALYVHRIVVDSWPTSDGQPWVRFCGPDAAVPNHEIPAWLAPLVDAALPHRHHYRDLSDLGRIAARIRYDDDRDEIRGVLMPIPQRVHYLSAPGVNQLVCDMRAFGAEVRVLRSERVAWPDTTP